MSELKIEKKYLEKWNNFIKNKKNKAKITGKDFIEFLNDSYKYVKHVTLRKKVKLKILKKKFNRCILVSNKIDIEKEEWTTFRFKNGDAHYFFTNLKLIYPMEKLPVFKLKEI